MAFSTSERGTDKVWCQNRYANCVCTRKVHTEGDCECDCGGSWRYDDDGIEVPVTLPRGLPDSPLSWLFQ